MIRELVQELKSRTYADADGEQQDFEFFPGLSDEAIQRVQQEYCPDGYPLPLDLVDLLKMCSGIDCDWFTRFDGAVEGQTADFLMRNEICMTLDGFGNSWNIYPSAEGDSLSQILYVSHDPPVIVYHCLGLEAFLLDWASGYAPPFKNFLAQMLDETSMGVYEGFKDLDFATSYRENNDPVLAEFARSLPDHFRVAYLRGHEFGTGIMWSLDMKGVPQTVKCPGHLIFATADTKKVGSSERKGFFARLFGK